MELYVLLQKIKTPTSYVATNFRTSPGRCIKTRANLPSQSGDGLKMWYTGCTLNFWHGKDDEAADLGWFRGIVHTLEEAVAALWEKWPVTAGNLRLGESTMAERSDGPKGGWGSVSLSLSLSLYLAI